MEGAVTKSGGRLILPNVTTDELKAYARAPHAILPNRFIAEVNDGGKAARSAEEAFEEAWRALAAAVYTQFVDGVARHGSGTRQIWDRQIAAFWELTWVVGEDDALIDQRKNWRLPTLTIEYGDRCSLMPPWQELSGYDSGQESGASAQKEFWSGLRESLKSPLDLDRRERLCAIALVKRLFPLLDSSTQHNLSGVRLNTESWPSTLDIATQPWKSSVAKNQSPKVLAAWNAFCSVAGGSERVRGTYLIKDALVMRERTADLSVEKRDALHEKLGILEDMVKTEPSKYYAILLADGDHMGAALRASRDAGNLDVFTRQMVDFAKSAPGIVNKHWGSCVYAGGDDVLALLPVPNAIQCAEQLAAGFEGTFGSGPEKPTLSVAVLFVHYRLPLSDAIRSSHELLDDVAKEETGRASLAIAVHKPSGPAAQFSAPWAWWHEKVGARSRIELLPVFVASDEFNAGSGLTRSYLYKVRDLFERLALDETRLVGRRTGASYNLGLELAPHLADLLAAELLVGRGSVSERQRESARALAERFVALSHPARRVDNEIRVDENAVSFSPARIAMFLATGGAEKT